MTIVNKINDEIDNLDPIEPLCPVADAFWTSKVKVIEETITRNGEHKASNEDLRIVIKTSANRLK